MLHSLLSNKYLGVTLICLGKLALTNNNLRHFSTENNNDINDVMHLKNIIKELQITVHTLVKKDQDRESKKENDKLDNISVIPITRQQHISPPPMPPFAQRDPQPRPFYPYPLPPPSFNLIPPPPVPPYYQNSAYEPHPYVHPNTQHVQRHNLSQTGNYATPFETHSNHPPLLPKNDVANSAVLKKVRTFDISPHLEIFDTAVSNICYNHNCDNDIAILHLNLQYLLRLLEYHKPPQNWINKKEFSFGEFLITLFFNPKFVEHLYSISIKDLNKILKENALGLKFFFLCNINSNLDPHFLKELLHESFADNTANTIHFEASIQTNSREMQKQRNRMKFKFIALLQRLFLLLTNYTFKNLPQLLSQERGMDVIDTYSKNIFLFNADHGQKFEKHYNSTFKIIPSLKKQEQQKKKLLREHASLDISKRFNSTELGRPKNKHDTSYLLPSRIPRKDFANAAYFKNVHSQLPVKMIPDTVEKSSKDNAVIHDQSTEEK